MRPALHTPFRVSTPAVTVFLLVSSSFSDAFSIGRHRCDVSKRRMHPKGGWRHDIIRNPNASTHTTNLKALPTMPEIFDPFSELGKQLFDSLDIGGAINNKLDVERSIPAATTGMVLDSIGRDLLVFLTASVLITPVATALNVTPILGYLLAGALLGPHGFDLFANSKADVELGDFGILFLLFSEGLEVTSSRLKELTNYLPLGFAQFSLCTGILTGAFLLGGPEFLEQFIPLDAGLINIHNPVEALILALAGTLSTSAFVFPVLKERNWEENLSGKAATSILLLQDLAVAPLLVLLPYVVGKGPTDYSAIAFLTAKATIGFGSVVYVGSLILKFVFQLVAQARSTETFVALCLLVSAGMGSIAKVLGLTDTAGAFAAGVLLANTNYRAQIQADILPFKGILLGVFFMVAGSSFDTDIVFRELPTVITGAITLIVLKLGTLLAATRIPERFEPNRLPIKDGVRLAFLLAGGGEFAFVVLALAEKLGVLPKDLGGLLTAIVLITMAVTPLLGQLAEFASEKFDDEPNDIMTEIEYSEIQENVIAEDAIIICGYGALGRSLTQALDNEYGEIASYHHEGGLPRIVAFDSDPYIASDRLLSPKHSIVLYGNAANAEVIQKSGAVDPTVIFVAYEDVEDVETCVARLRVAFRETPIYARAQTRDEAIILQTLGATEVIVESDQLPQSAVSLLKGTNSWMYPKSDNLSDQPLHLAAAAAAGMTAVEVDVLLRLFDCMEKEKSGRVSADELVRLIRMTNTRVKSDDEINFMEKWIKSVVSSPLSAVEFCRIYAVAPTSIQEAFQCSACLF
mmetsp:Transcript_9471/g.12283  ORF Transcript_9471/g.12283 Transcript_9471/m.12283 type:complete len:804 (+) Transcript_9471:198-2609(+)